MVPCKVKIFCGFSLVGRRGTLIFAERILNVSIFNVITMKPRVFVFAFLLLVCGMFSPVWGTQLTVIAPLPGDSIVFQGRVVNGQGIPLKDAMIVAQSTEVRVRTGLDGLFTLVLAKADSVVVEKEGMAPFRCLVDYNYKGIVVLGAEQSIWMSNAEYVKQMTPAAKEYLAAGQKFLSGEGGQEPDVKKALACFWRAAGMEYPLGYYHLGKMFEEGKGVTQNVQAAVGFYEKAVGVAEAQTRLGQLYAEGRFVEQDYKKAAQYYSQAVDDGDTGAAKAALEKLLKDGLVSENDLADNKVYEIVEVNASFPGGDEACKRWLAQHIKYPKKALEMGIQGRVVVSFVVDREGYITDVKVMKSPDSSLAMEATRLINAMPKWQPAVQGKKKVRSRFSLPINFRLSSM